MLSHVNRVCSGLQARSSLLTEAWDSFCHWFLLPGLQRLRCLGTDWTGLPNLAVLQGSASQSQLVIFAAVIWEQTGLAFMETITWVTQENRNHRLQLPSCNQAGDGLNTPVCQGAHWHLQVTGSSSVANYSCWAQASSSLWAVELTEWGQTSSLSWASSFWGGGSCTTNGNWTHSLSHV